MPKIDCISPTTSNLIGVGACVRPNRRIHSWLWSLSLLTLVKLFNSIEHLEPRYWYRFKMADAPLVLNDVLRFMVNKYVKVHVRQLKNVLADFYTAELLSEAKECLLRDVEALNLTIRNAWALYLHMSLLTPTTCHLFVYLRVIWMS